MSRIYGVVCDGCRQFDLVSVEEPMYEDLVPRNNWLSINAYGDDGNAEGSELHACSGACLETISRKLRGMNPDDHQHEEE